MSFLKPRTGIRIRPLEPGEPGYGPESEAFLKAFMESEPGDEFDTALRNRLGELANEWERIKAKRGGIEESEASTASDRP